MINDANFYAIENLCGLRIPVDQLKALIARLPGYKTVEALCIDITGCVVAGRMLNRLLYWFPRSKTDGWVYKSHEDWYAELRITRSQAYRAADKLREVGVEVRRRNTTGAPKMHYLLTDGFVRVLAGLLQMDRLKLKIFLCGNAQSIAQEGTNRLHVSDAMDCTPASNPNTAATTTSTHTTSPNGEIPQQHNTAAADQESSDGTDEFLAGTNPEGNSMNGESNPAGDAITPTPVSAAPLPQALLWVCERGLAAEEARELVRTYGADVVERAAAGVTWAQNPPGAMKQALKLGHYRQNATDGERKFSGRLSEWSER